jgi:hypothetical protein
MPFLGPLRRERNAKDKTPLAGIVDVVLRHNNKSRVYPALIDTGSPISTISAKALIFLQPPKRGSMDVHGATDAVRPDGDTKYDFYRIEELHFAGSVYENYPLYLLTKRDEEMIIGRDILLKHLVILDGPNEELHID